LRDWADHPGFLLPSHFPFRRGQREGGVEREEKRRELTGAGNFAAGLFLLLGDLFSFLSWLIAPFEKGEKGEGEGKSLGTDRYGLYLFSRRGEEGGVSVFRSLLFLYLLVCQDGGGEGRGKRTKFLLAIASRLHSFPYRCDGGEERRRGEERERYGFALADYFRLSLFFSPAQEACCEKKEGGKRKRGGRGNILAER